MIEHKTDKDGTPFTRLTCSACGDSVLLPGSWTEEMLQYVDNWLIGVPAGDFCFLCASILLVSSDDVEGDSDLDHIAKDAGLDSCDSEVVSVGKLRRYFATKGEALYTPISGDVCPMLIYGFTVSFTEECKYDYS